jgi:hypothetical protein
MPEQGFEISVTKESVDVRRNVSFLTQRYGTYIGIAYMALAMALFYWVVVSPHGTNSSIWTLITKYGPQDHDFGEAVFGLFALGSLLGVTFFLGLRTFFPSGDALHCDRTTFTASKIPWFSLNGRWKVNSYPVSDISQLRFAKILSNRSGDPFMGLRFLAAGKKQKLFIGLEAPEAHKILKGLLALGVDVNIEPEMDNLVEYVQSERRMNLDSR